MERKPFRRIAAAVLRIIAALAAAILCEFLFFNLKALKTSGREWVPLPEPETAGDFAEDGSLSIIFSDLYREIGTCHILIEVRDKNGDVAATDLEVFLTDDGNHWEYSAGHISYTPSHDKGSYFILNAYGRILTLTLRLTAPENGCTYSLLAAETGGSIPFRISYPRITGLFLLFLLIYVLRPSSVLYDNRTWNRCRAAKILAVLLILILNLAALGVLAMQNRTYAGLTEDSVKFSHHFQYAKLARAFAEGKVWIDTPEDQEALRTLAGLADPYDLAERMAAGVSQIWDTAYYNGHLYVYFGAVPVLLGYLPYYLVTGSALPTIYAAILSGALCVIAAFCFMRSLIRRYFPTTPFPVYLMLSLLLGNGTVVLSYAADPSFYIVPVYFSLFFVLTALTLWISAAERLSLPAPEADPETLCFRSVRSSGKDTGIFLRIAAGSLCAALVTGCRPQFLVFSALALPIFLPLFFKARPSAGNSLPSPSGHKKKSRLLWGILSFALPFVIAALPLMYYNLIRFGSPFDFGAAYNLTTNDMTRRGFRLLRLPDGFFAYLFQLPNLSIRFPYILETPENYIYIGRTVSEPMFGGVLLLFPFLWMLLRFGKAAPTLRKRRLFGFTLLPAFLSLVVIAADTEMAGILWRYTGDFLLLLYLPSALVFLSLLDETAEDGRRRLIRFLVYATAATLLICLLTSLMSGNLLIRSPETYFRLKDFLSLG